MSEADRTMFRAECI